jgi:light-regulated signal transduction histidine kinase (bacteriophytochrome)
MARVHKGTFPGMPDIKRAGGGSAPKTGSLPQSGGLDNHPAPLALGGALLDAAKVPGGGSRFAVNGADDLLRPAAGLPNVFDLFTDGNMSVAQLLPCQTDLETAQRLEELGRTNERLYELQAQAEAEAEESRTRLIETTETLETICSALTDELRGPLRCLTSLTQLLLKENGWTMNESGKKYAERITDSATRMDNLIQDLLKYGRMSRQDLSCENVSLETCLCQAMGGMAGILSAKDAEVSMERPFPQVWGNAPTLREVLTQLMDSTLKLAVPEETPCVRIWAESDEAAVRLYIEDHGAVRGPERTDKIVNLPPRAGNGHPDMGIGLVLVEKGMEKMGGRAGMEFVPGNGSRFWIELGHPR